MRLNWRQWCGLNRRRILLSNTIVACDGGTHMKEPICKAVMNLDSVLQMKPKVDLHLNGIVSE